MPGFKSRVFLGFLVKNFSSSQDFPGSNSWVQETTQSHHSVGEPRVFPGSSVEPFAMQAEGDIHMAQGPATASGSPERAFGSMVAEIAGSVQVEQAATETARVETQPTHGQAETALQGDRSKFSPGGHPPSWFTANENPILAGKAKSPSPERPASIQVPGSNYEAGWADVQLEPEAPPAGIRTHSGWGPGYVVQQGAQGIQGFPG